MLLLINSLYKKYKTTMSEATFHNAFMNFYDDLTGIEQKEHNKLELKFKNYLEGAK